MTDFPFDWVFDERARRIEAPAPCGVSAIESEPASTGSVWRLNKNPGIEFDICQGGRARLDA
jgi:hypothetical protein